MRDSITLMCEVCKNRNYRTTKKAKESGRIDIKKFCRFCRHHTLHKEQKK